MQAPNPPTIVCPECGGKMDAGSDYTPWAYGSGVEAYVFGYVCAACGKEEPLLVQADGEVPKRTLYSDQHHAAYAIVDNERGEPLLIMDIGKGKRKSVTTDIVWVLEQLDAKGLLLHSRTIDGSHKWLAIRRLFYIDREGVTAEVLLKGKKFAGYREYPYYTKEVICE